MKKDHSIQSVMDSFLSWHTDRVLPEKQSNVQVGERTKSMTRTEISFQGHFAVKLGQSVSSWISSSNERVFRDFPSGTARAL